MSTRQLDNNYSQKLPELRTTAKKYGRWAPREQTDIVINTSAIGRAFPGFSQGGSSDDSMSLEVARAPKSHQQRLAPSRIARAEYSDNLESSNVVTTLGSVKILGTPQKSHTKPTILPRRDTASHKENIPPPNDQQPTKHSPYVSHASRATSGERRTLAELHAKVADDTDGSFIGDERPATVTFQPKTTRFSTTRTNSSHVANVSSKRQDVEDDLVEKLRTASGTPSKSQTKLQTNHTMTSNTPNPTQQSFLLPNMLETSEVIPASFNKGTGIPLPGEEQDIYVNIDLLKDRVADLEIQLARSLNLREQLEDEIRHSKRQSLTQSEHFKVQMERDQAVAQLAESFKRGEQLENEVRQLKKQQSLIQSELSSIRMERDQTVLRLAESLKRNAQLENEIQQLKKQQLLTQSELSGIRIERDQAVAQLAETVKQNEQLKFDNEDLKIEVDERRKYSEELTTESTQSLQDQRKENESLRGQLQRRDKVINKLQNATQEIQQSFTRIERSKTKSKPNPQEASFDISTDSSYASIVGPGFMSNLRQQVDNARATKAESHNQEDLTGRFSIKSARRVDKDHTIQSNASHRRHSETAGQAEKDHTVQSNVSHRRHSETAGRVEEDHTIRSNISHRRQHSETSVHTRTTRHRRNEIDDMTSAFIIPDISFNAITTEGVHPTLSANARRVLDSLCKHDCTNCTVCTRVASFDTKNHTKQKISIPKPIPVSERMPEPTPYEDEPTIRPSVEPGLALGTVIKGLEDEVAHLKLEHTRIAAAYAKHDSSLGMRQRKALKRRLDELLIAIEKKSDQVYALYDVLEGQKQSGQEMSDKDIEVTLLSIGIGKDAEDEELDLPWEGIDDTES